MAEGKKTFIFYSDWGNMVREMPNEQAGELLKHVLSYVNDENPETDNILVRTVFAHMKPILKKDLAKWEEIREVRKKAGSKGGKRTQANAKQMLEVDKQVQAVNDNVNVSKDKNIYKPSKLSLEERKKEFKKELVKLQDQKFDVDLLKDFFIYWSEHGEHDKKMRFEREKTFGLKARLHTWWRNKEARKVVKEKY